jgi:hypothetical protein
VIAGGAEYFMAVRHLVLSGTNEEIGRALATLARGRFRVTFAQATRHFRFVLDKAGPIASMTGR